MRSLWEAVREFQAEGHMKDDYEYGISDDDCADRLRVVFALLDVEFVDDYAVHVWLEKEAAACRQRQYYAEHPEAAERLRAYLATSRTFFAVSNRILHAAYERHAADAEPGPYLGIDWK